PQSLGGCRRCRSGPAPPARAPAALSLLPTGTVRILRRPRPLSIPRRCPAPASGRGILQRGREGSGRQNRTLSPPVPEDVAVDPLQPEVESELDPSPPESAGAERGRPGDPRSVLRWFQ